SRGAPEETEPECAGATPGGLSGVERMRYSCTCATGPGRGRSIRVKRRSRTSATVAPARRSAQRVSARGARLPADEQAGVLADPQAAAPGAEPGLHRVDHTGVVGRAGILDRRRRGQVVDHVVRIAAVEPVTVRPPI